MKLVSTFSVELLAGAQIGNQQRLKKPQHVCAAEYYSVIKMKSCD